MAERMIWLFFLSLLSGVLGRLGGAAGYNKLWRRLGCSLIVVISSILCFGWVSSLWYVYLSVLLLSYSAFSTYWDRLFGEDCHWFSGLMVGVAAFPLMMVSPVAIWILVVRAVALAIIWGLLEKLPDKVFIWRRDVASEFLRYFFSL